MRGFSLIGTLWLLALLTALSLASFEVLSSVRGRLGAHKLRQQANAMAISGSDYASAQIHAGRWRGEQKFRSPYFAGGGYFEVETRLQGSGYRILSRGHAGAATISLETVP